MTGRIGFRKYLHMQEIYLGYLQLQVYHLA
jgi:hypothetical protein